MFIYGKILPIYWGDFYATERARFSRQKRYKLPFSKGRKVKSISLGCLSGSTYRKEWQTGKII